MAIHQEPDLEETMPAYTTIDSLDAALSRVRDLERANEYLHEKNEALEALCQSLVAKLPQHTCVACSLCHEGVRHSYAVPVPGGDGHAVLCSGCASAAIARLRAEQAAMREWGLQMATECERAQTLLDAERACTERLRSQVNGADEIDDRDILTAFSAAERLRSLATEHPAIERFVRHCEENGVLAALESQEKRDRGDAAYQRFKANAQKLAEINRNVPDMTDEQLLAAIDAIREEGAY